MKRFPEKRSVICRARWDRIDSRAMTARCGGERLAGHVARHRIEYRTSRSLVARTRRSAQFGMNLVYSSPRWDYLRKPGTWLS